ncbi:16664_t:CDS:1 [Funneliformis mosseae]|uniref:16664_t:CDS:1 n=1 Tax=Funneliformis mosseae TaxID=27381 RepID=A0A9N9GUI6_FUNMO|nr:16664_t:CDS:1 [Funneliformis mosseae]
MGQKRTIASIFNEITKTSSEARSIQSIVQPRKNPKVPYFYSNCKSLVDHCTRTRHELLGKLNNLYSANVSADNSLSSLSEIYLQDESSADIFRNPKVRININDELYKSTALNE